MTKSVIKVTLLGDVDHGKSTLIGRLLAELSPVHADLPTEDLAFAMDGLVEEREGLFTLDTAQTVLELGERTLVLIDVPGHFELLRNMMSGATQADAGLLVVDTERGLGPQSRRHLTLLGLLGVRSCIAVCNKMDALGGRREAYDALAAELYPVARSVGVDLSAVIPISALTGDNVSRRSEELSWYVGPTLLEALGAVRPSSSARMLRVTLQDRYLRAGVPLYAARVDAGELRCGTHRLYPIDASCEVTAIERFDEPPVTAAKTGDCIGLRISTDVEVGAGMVLTHSDAPPRVGRRLRARVVSLSRDAINTSHALQLRGLVDEVNCRLVTIHERLSTESLDSLGTDNTEIQFSNLALVEIETERPVVYDLFEELPSLGRFVLTHHGEVVAAGLLEPAA